MSALAYGPSPDQVGDLHWPAAHPPRRGAPGLPPVICLLHGGYWRMPWSRAHIAPLVVPLSRLGFVVWNIEYRRVGAPGGGWPGTLQDVGAAIDQLATLADRIDLQRVVTVGHSAGGHLALWAASGDTDLGPRRVHVAAAVGLAPVCDLVWAYEERCGNGAVEGLLGGSPGEYPERYREASPTARLPLGVRQLILHGTPDEDVPVEISRRYARAARAAGDDLTFHELPATAHMDFVDPASTATAVLLEWLSGPSAARA